ncbi:hypothetical protein EOI86_02220 [Hwanghaeella grinnelliae]|uniref:Uncharacterized protein n=1 Tax=Hwanghaeella grinnelliae TaxID=2500179 RepID=A0A437QUH5_9PROT|nr:hypothetical protein [Hwanghaeella grinnelliae]RVU38139.1 hypothetical protein EOI86_02220 [Hwanghaeella grinnelliae]
MSKPKIRSRELQSEILSSVLEEGAALSIYLEPDTNGPLSNAKEPYCESYQLDFVIAENNVAFAFTSGDHFNTLAHVCNLYRSYYAYTNVQDAWIHYFPAMVNGETVAQTTLMSLASYRHLEWIAQPKYHRIFDSDQSANSSKMLLEAIRSGCAFCVSLLDEGGIWRRAPVDLFFYHEESKRFQLQTAIHWYPGIFDHPIAIETEFAQKGYPNRTAPNANRIRHEQSYPASSTYLSIWTDGAYDNVVTIEKGHQLKWKRLLIFAESNR